MVIDKEEFINRLNSWKKISFRRVVISKRDNLNDGMILYDIFVRDDLKLFSQMYITQTEDVASAYKIKTKLEKWMRIFNRSHESDLKKLDQ